MCLSVWSAVLYQWPIHEFADGGVASPWDRSENLMFDKIFVDNCVKMKEIGPSGGVPSTPSLDPPMYMFLFSSGDYVWY